MARGTNSQPSAYLSQIHALDVTAMAQLRLSTYYDCGRRTNG